MEVQNHREARRGSCIFGLTRFWMPFVQYFGFLHYLHLCGTLLGNKPPYNMHTACDLRVLDLLVVQGASLTAFLAVLSKLKESGWPVGIGSARFTQVEQRSKFCYLA